MTASAIAAIFEDEVVDEHVDAPSASDRAHTPAEDRRDDERMAKVQAKAEAKAARDEARAAARAEREQAKAAARAEREEAKAATRAAREEARAAAHEPDPEELIAAPVVDDGADPRAEAKAAREEARAARAEAKAAAKLERQVAGQDDDSRKRQDADERAARVQAKAEADVAKQKARDEASAAKAAAKRERAEAKSAARQGARQSKAAHRADDDHIVEAPREPRKALLERLRPAPADKEDGNEASSNVLPTIAVVLGALGFVFSVILAIGAFMVALNPQDEGGLFGLVSNVCDFLVGPLRGMFSFSGVNGESKEALVAWGLGALGYLVLGLFAQSFLRARSEDD